ncbi:uracil-DNA glycosylase [Xanthobacter sp. TB0139]|uniref:uracil-DNA glycosylase n=1 Tax=Xanthobacter sp. TB0139 TaxID=3459178 RepID=UPI00403A3D6F
MTQLSSDEWFDILAFHAEAGVDVALADAPIDRFAESAAEASAPRQPAGAGLRPDTPPAAQAARQAASGAASFHGAPAPASAAHSAAPHAPDEAALAAREAVGAAMDLDALRAIMEQFEGCALKRTASRLVFADGNPQARVMFVGEAPGREEDQQGLPFVGRAGRLLDLMLASIGLDRTSAYIANIVPWRPPGNRTPTPQETAICLPFIRRQIELANPDIVVCLGKPSAQALMNSTQSISRLRGHFVDYETGTRTIRAIATFHPAYLLRAPIGKRQAWQDMLAVEAALKQGAE